MIYLPAILLSPLTLATILPKRPKEAAPNIAGRIVTGAAGAGGTGAAIGTAAAGAFTGGLAAPAGALIGGILGVGVGGIIGYVSGREKKVSCIQCQETHIPSESEYVCPNTNKYNLSPSDLRMDNVQWFSIEDAAVYIGVNFNLTEGESLLAAQEMYRYAVNNRERIRQSSMGGDLKIFHEDFLGLVSLQNWVDPLADL